MAIEITDEIRRAVYAADCDRLGHQISIREAVRVDQRGRSGVTSADNLKLPHLICARCEQVWIVLPAEAATYEDGERIAYGQLRADAELSRRIVRQRGQREERDRPPRPRATGATPGTPP